MRSKRGQVTLFVIIAILIVAAVILAIVLVPKLNKPKAGQTDQMNPETYIADCINDDLEPMVELISKQGGGLELKNCIFYKTANDFCRAYLCYQTIPYSACINQEPLLKEKIEQQLKNELIKSNTVSRCITDFSNTAKQKDYSITTCSNPQFNVTLIKGKVTVPINCEITLSKEETKKFSSIVPALNWPLYDFVLVSKEIINQEITNTDFDPVSYMLQNNWIEVEKFRSTSDSGISKIYTLRERSSGKEFVFALKNNYWNPAGIL